MRFKVKEYIEKRGISAYSIEHGADINHKTLSDIINNKTRGITFKTLDKLCWYLGCSVSDLIEPRKW